jgi:hypothetical protein
MTTQKFTLTATQAIASAIALLNGETAQFETGEIVARLAHELDVRTKAQERKANAPKRESSTAKENAALLNAVLGILPTVGYNEDGKPQGGFNLANITAKVPNIMTASKLGVVLRPAINDGTVIKYRGRLNGKTVTFYALA